MLVHCFHSFIFFSMCPVRKTSRQSVSADFIHFLVRHKLKLHGEWVIPKFFCDSFYMAYAFFESIRRETIFLFLRKIKMVYFYAHTRLTIPSFRISLLKN